MLSTTEEINLYRLLTSCENELKKQPIDVWEPSEKRKFATYVKYLVDLQAKSSKTTFSDRIHQLSAIVSIHTSYVHVEKGIAEARLVKKRHRDHLRQLEKPHPEWLSELKHELDATKKPSFQKQETPVEETKTKPSEKTELRQRNVTHETNNMEHVLQHHRQLHDELTTDLSRMAQQLKLNSQAFGDTLSKDDLILKDAQKAVESNLSHMTKERQRLDQHYAKSWGTSFMSMALVLFVSIMFVLVFFTIKFLPKA
ncbi:vesicle transport protein [Choanephora cucurbitarum]|nr:vesicle transport protein [Choanephora cucurbitarum]